MALGHVQRGRRREAASLVQPVQPGRGAQRFINLCRGIGSASCLQGADGAGTLGDSSPRSPPSPDPDPPGHFPAWLLMPRGSRGVSAAFVYSLWKQQFMSNFADQFRICSVLLLSLDIHLGDLLSANSKCIQLGSYF